MPNSNLHILQLEYEISTPVTFPSSKLSTLNVAIVDSLLLLIQQHTVPHVATSRRPNKPDDRADPCISNVNDQAHENTDKEQSQERCHNLANNRDLRQPVQGSGEHAAPQPKIEDSHHRSGSHSHGPRETEDCEEEGTLG